VSAAEGARDGTAVRGVGSGAGSGSTPGGPSGPPPAGRDLEATIARVLRAGTYASVALIAVGVALMVAHGISPLDTPPPLDPGGVVAGLAGLRPEGVLALGLVGIIFTPTIRVVASLIGYLEDGERRMALISLGILGVIALSVVLAIGLEG
jgi:uncharacterized membrane protein